MCGMTEDAVDLVSDDKEEKKRRGTIGEVEHRPGYVYDRFFGQTSRSLLQNWHYKKRSEMEMESLSNEKTYRESEASASLQCT